MPDPVTELNVEGLDVESLKGKTGITEDDSLKIAAQVMAEEEQAEKANRSKEKEEVSHDADDKQEDNEQSAEDKEKEATEKKEAEDKVKAEEAKKKEEETAKFVEDYSKEHGVTVDEARQDLDSINKIAEKYGKDAMQLAKANLHIQRLYTKTQEELKAVNEAKPSQQEITIEGIIKNVDEGKITVNGKALSREELINTYRENNPDLTEGVDDEPVLKMAAKDIREHITRKHQEQQSQLVIDAKAKKEKLLSGLSAEDKELLPDIKPIIDNLPPSQVMDERFSMHDTIAWARGKKYTPAYVKELEEKAYKRGLEQAKIVGSQAGDSNINSTPKKSKAIVLSEEQKKEALQHFENMEITDEKKYEYYAEILASDVKEKVRK